MWPFGKKGRQPEAKVEEKPKLSEEELKQKILSQLEWDPVAKTLKIRQKEPEQATQEPEMPPIVEPEPAPEVKLEPPAKQECPTCKKPLVKSTKNRHKCPYCKNWIYFLGDRPVTQDEHEHLAESFYQARHAERLRQTMGEELVGIGLSEDMLNRREHEMLAKTRVRPMKSAVIMSLFNETILGLKDFNEMERRYHDLAIILNKGGEDCFHILQAAAKTKLAAYKAEGVKKVSVFASQNCEACKKVDGKVMTIEEALKTMPIPLKDCPNHPYNENLSFCICGFEPEYDDQYWRNKA
jgi:hypothetical protein